MAPITATYVLFLGILLTGLALNTTRQRIRGGLGKSPDPAAKAAIQRASRAHGNALEHGLVVALLLFFSEVHGVSAAALQGIVGVFFVARALHAYGYITRPASRPMQLGSVLTYVLEIILLNLLGVALFG